MFVSGQTYCPEITCERDDYDDMRKGSKVRSECKEHPDRLQEMMTEKKEETEVKQEMMTAT